MKKVVIFTILIASLALTGCAVKKGVEVGDNAQNEINNAQPASSTPTGGQAEQKDATQTGNDKIKVFNIEDGQTVYSPLTVSGQATASENNLIVELRNSDHKTLVKETVKIYNSGQAGEMGDYSINKLNFVFKNTKEGFIAVYEEGADGSELNLVEIPVKFGNLDTSAWQTYQNKEYGFEIKYPSTFQYSENNEARSGVSFSGQGYNLIIYKPFPAIGFEPWEPVYKKAIKTNDPNTNLFYLYMKANENIGYEGTKDVIHIFWQKGETNYKEYLEKDSKLELDPNNNGLMTFDNVDNTDLLEKIISTFKFTN